MLLVQWHTSSSWDNYHWLFFLESLSTNVRLVRNIVEMKLAKGQYQLILAEGWYENWYLCFLLFVSTLEKKKQLNIIIISSVPQVKLKKKNGNLRMSDAKCYTSDMKSFLQMPQQRRKTKGLYFFIDDKKNSTKHNELCNEKSTFVKELSRLYWNLWKCIYCTFCFYCILNNMFSCFLIISLYLTLLCFLSKLKLKSFHWDYFPEFADKVTKRHVKIIGGMW